MRRSGRTQAERQRQTYEYVRRYISENGYSPSVREIMKALDIRSTSTVFSDLKALNEQGLIKTDTNRSRTITIVPVDATYEEAYEAAKTIALFCSDRQCETCPALLEGETCLLQNIAFGS